MIKFVFNGERLNGVVYKSSNIIIQMIQRGTSRERCFLVGSGYTLNVNEKDVVIWHDPAMLKMDYGMQKDVTIFTYYYTYECAGLEPAAREIATFINSNLFGKYERIFLIGHSKCGLCLYKSTEYLESFVTLVTISCPFEGTIVADYKSVQKKIKSKLLMWIYRKIFSNHNVDLDIIPGSVFLKNLNDPYCIEHINITSRLAGKKIYFNSIDLFLLVVDKVLGIDGDGVVPYSSQKTKSDQCITINCSHANSLKVGLHKIEQYSQILR